MPKTKTPHVAKLYSFLAKDYRDADVELEIDLDAIIRELGQRASNAKTKKATAMGGAITVNFKRFHPIC